MRALDHVEVEHLVPVQDAEIHGFLGAVGERDGHGPADLPQRGVISNPGAQPCQFRTHDVGAGIVTQKIAFARQMRQESVGSALVNPSLLGDFTKLQPGGRSVQRLQDAQHFSNHADGRRF